MSRRDRIRRQWTHRRLGLGAALTSDVAMEQTEAMLTAVGARRTTSGSVGDGFETALLDYVCDIDLVANVAVVDGTPIPIAALRAKVSPRRRPRLTWRVLIPAASTGVAALALVLTLVLAGGSSTSPALSVTAESKQLLNHADMLLSAAQSATATQRAKLVTEAKADLSHVSQLIPLAPAPDRQGIRQQLQLLDNRARPLASSSPSPSRRWSSGAGGGANNVTPSGGTHMTGSGTASGGDQEPGYGGGDAGTAGGGTGTNPGYRKPVRRPPAPGSGTGTGAGTGTGSGGGGGAQSGPPPASTSGQTATQPSGTGTQPPSRSGSDAGVPPRQSAPSGLAYQQPSSSGQQPRG